VCTSHNGGEAELPRACRFVAHTINDSGQGGGSSLGSCPRGGVELAHACRFATVEPTIPGSRTELPRSRHPQLRGEHDGGCPRGRLELSGACHFAAT
jgi:hypothetical protein